MNSAIIKEIRISVAKGVSQVCPEGTFIVGLGLESEPFSKPGERQVSMLMGEHEAEIRATDGLCTKRFNANLITSGLDFRTLSPGMRLRIGPCCLEVTSVGKRCFPEECALRKSGRICKLPSSVAFARVLEGGTLRPGESILPE